MNSECGLVLSGCKCYCSQHSSLSASSLSAGRVGEGNRVKATLNLALLMCLSLWAYYIQIKGEFTDRRQAPAPISNQTLPSGRPCGAHICGHSLTAWHHSVLQESSTRITGSCEQERASLADAFEDWATSWRTLPKYVMVYMMFLLQNEHGDQDTREDAYSCRRLPLFKALAPLPLKSLSESLFVTLLASFSLPLSDNTMWVLYPCLCAL